MGEENLWVRRKCRRAHTVVVVVLLCAVRKGGKKTVVVGKAGGRTDGRAGGPSLSGAPHEGIDEQVVVVVAENESASPSRYPTPRLIRPRDNNV